MKRLSLLTLAALFVACFAQGADRPNVLLTLVDDLKPNLGCYGDSPAKTPNIDQLASRGLRFERACCNQSVCAPSRNNLMLGTHSTSLGIYSLHQNFRLGAPDAVTLTQYFMKHGWRTEAIGKILHTDHGNHDDDASWSIPPRHDKVVEYLQPENSADGRLTREKACYELYDYREDPRNWAKNRPEVVKELLQILARHPEAREL